MTKIAPPRITRSVDGALLLARICSPEDGCVLSGAVLCLKIDADGSWVAAFHDAGNPLRNAQASGTDPVESAAINRILDALASIR